MEAKIISPIEAEVSDLNERKNVDLDHKGRIKEDDAEDIVEEGLVENVRKSGIANPLIVRKMAGVSEDDIVQYEVIIGQRRLLASRLVGLDEVPVMVVDWDDAEALKMSIIENVDMFQKKVPTGDRAQALQRLWNLKMGEDAGRPQASKLADELGGVTRQTISRWLEPLREEWEDTPVDPTSDRSDDTGADTSDSEDDTPASADESDTGSDAGEQEDVNDRQQEDDSSVGEPDDDSKSDGESESQDGSNIVDEAATGDEIDPAEESELQNLSEQKMSWARLMADGDTDKALDILRLINEKDIPTNKIREVKERVDHGADPFEELEKISQDEKDEQSTEDADSDDHGGSDAVDSEDASEGEVESQPDTKSDESVGEALGEFDADEEEEDDRQTSEQAKSGKRKRITFTLTGDAAEVTEELAKEKQTSTNEVVRERYLQALRDNGEL